MERSKSFDAIYERLLKSSGAQNDSELARVLNISPQSVNGARKRGEVPPSWVQFYAETSGVSSDWLFFGRGPMRLSDRPIDYQVAVMQRFLSRAHDAPSWKTSWIHWRKSVET